MDGRGDRIEALFGDALEVPPEERDAWLERVCDDAGMRAEVASLLAHHRDGPTVVFQRARSERDALLPALTATSAEALPPSVGPYGVRARLGRGGSGEVFLAVQDAPRRDIAVKRLDTTLDGSAARERFRREAAALARLDGLGLPGLFDAGVEPDGTPWLAMPLVRGAPLTEHARAAGLDLRARVTLLARVAATVGRIHAAGVVHRDLKPENVLVDADGVPHVLDFGIARLLDIGAWGGRPGPAAHARPTSPLTTAGQLLGTPAYMSPEQAAGEPAAVDARGDVHALGVLLYELVCERLPWTAQGSELHALLRQVAEERPAPVDDDVPDELRLVLNKALAKDPADRYADGHALAADLARWLDGRPVLARPPGPWRIGRRFAARHPARAAALLLGAVTLLAGFGLALVGLAEARRDERRAADRHAELASLSDERRLAGLHERAATLWPAWPQQRDALTAWLADAEGLLARRGWHADEADALQSADPHDATAAWRLELHRSILAGLDALADPAPHDDTRADVRRRLLHAETLDDPSHDPAWDAARARVAAAPIYAGLRLSALPGLLPLGPDPRTGLEEFAEAGLTGTPPTRAPDDGRLLLSEDSAVVFVLVPGGESLLGAQADNPGAPRHDPRAFAHEGPPTVVHLDPFLIAKHELTQGQWRRLTGRSPTWFGQGEEWYGERITGRHPVTGISWREAARWLARLAWVLPTEARWEHATRAGTGTPWWVADDPLALGGTVNLRDLSLAAADQPPVDAAQEALDAGLLPYDDGHAGPAAVDADTPNPFGLHGTLGNVWELTRDVYRTRVDLPMRPGDGLKLVEANGLRTLRGGSFESPLHHGRVSFRTDDSEVRAGPQTGLRPAVDVIPAETAP